MKILAIMLTACAVALASSNPAPETPIASGQNTWQVPVTVPLLQENDRTPNKTDIIPRFSGISRERFIPVAYGNATNITFSNGISFDTKSLGKKGEPELPEALKFEYRGNEPGYYIVQFSGPVYEAQKEWLDASGARIHFYVPDYGFVVSIDDPGTADAISTNPAINWVGIYQPAYKISQRFEPVSEEHKVTILLFLDADLQSVLKEVNAITQRSEFDISDNGINKIIRGVINKKDLDALARIKGIYWIEPYIQPVQHNQQYQWVVQTGYRGTAPGGGDNTARRMWGMGILGQGEIINHCDSGINCSHYQHRSGSAAITTWGVYPTHNAICAYDSGAPTTIVFGDGMGSVWHGTHTGCTASGDDTTLGTSYYDGIAKQAKIYHNDCGDNSSSSIYTFGDLNDLYIRSYTKYYASYGIRAYTSTNSWGASNGGAYDAMCLNVDQFMWSHRDFCLFYSNGNDGGANTVGSPASAKNCVSVGGTLNSTSCNSYYTTTSRGPTDDGRLKPTILTPGSGITSAGSGTNTYISLSGTSMSSPGACASGALARQYLREGWYPTGKKVAGNAWAYISAAMIKAIMINCADNNITSYTVPDNNVGWGRIDLDSTLYFSGDSRKTLLDDDTIGVLTGERADYHINVPSGATTLKITVVWTDYPGNPAISRQIVNDLDLYVQIGGTYYRGNQYSGGQSSANPSTRDSLNVEECVRVNAPTSGDWLIRVEGRNVPYGPQPFALVVTYSATAVAGVVHTDKPVYRANDFIVDTVRVRVEDPNYGTVGIRDTVIVSIVGKYIETQPETLRCVELAESSYIFKAQIPLLFRGATHGDSRLSVCQGDTLTVTYVDANPSYTSTTWAAIDAWYFIISNAHCENIEATQADMCWTTNEGANSIVYYGTNPSNLNLIVTVDTPYCMPHRVRLPSLAPSTIYYCDVASRDFRGNLVRDNNGGAHYTFKTKAQAGVDILVILADGYTDATPTGQPLPQLRERFRRGVEKGGWTYSYWETSDNAGYTPSRNVIKNFKAVFTVFEDEYPPFFPIEQETIRSYEERGGRIAFASHDVLWHAWDNSSTPAYDTAWCRNYMQARYTYDLTPVGTYNIYGISGDPISGPYVSPNQVSYTAHRDGACADSLQPLNNVSWVNGSGTGVWRWNAATGGRVGSRWESATVVGTPGDGVWGGQRTRTIMNAFSITQMDTVKLPDILNNEFIWLIGHDHPDVTVSSPVGGNTYSSSPINIAWTTTTYGGTYADTTWLEYSPDGGNTWYLITYGTGMTSPYSWNISALQNGSKYRVRVTACDGGLYPSMRGFAETGNFIINIAGNDDIGPKVIPNTIIVNNNPKFITPTDTLLPFTADVSDSETGLSTIGAASYRAVSQTGNSSGEIAMAVWDGGWDEIQERVNASIRFIYIPGAVNICTLSVRARDNAAKALNWGVWYSRTFTIIDGDIRPLVGVDEFTAQAPVAYAFGNPVPNPALGSVRITYALPIQSKVSLKIYNSIGQLVRTAVLAEQKAGYYVFNWNGTDDTGRYLAAGIYFYHFSAGQFQSTRKSVLLK